MQATLLDPAYTPSAAGDEAIEVSVVMPCLNEARTVGRCVAKAVRALEAMGVRGEVLVADNGSADGSQTIAREHGARVVAVERKGYGSALQGGIAAARGKYVIMGDADDSYDFSKLEAFVERLRAGDDLVMGNRFKGGILPGAMPPLHQYFGNPVMTGILNFLFRSPIGDAQCGLRGFRKDSYQKWGVLTPGMEFASEMVVRACLHKQKISEVPTVLHPDGRGRPPHMRSFRDGWRNLRFLLLMSPLWLYRVPSVVLMGLGLCLMVWLTPGPQQVGRIVFDVHSMLLGALCVVLGYQTLWLWAFARIHGWSSGLLPPEDTTSAKTFLQEFQLERGLLAGLGLTAAGLAILGWLVVYWCQHQLGPLPVPFTFRWALWGFTLLVLGVQTVYGSFFLTMLNLALKREG